MDVPTLVAFLFEFESPSDIAEYVKDFMPSASQAHDFAADFVLRRNSGKGAKPAAAQPRKASDAEQWQQVPSGKGGKGKKKKGKFNKVAGDVLGYSVTSGGGPNRGELDFGN